MELALHKEYNNQAPTFSSIIPIHNQEDFVVKQIERILLSTLGHQEIITIPDNCTDNSKEHLLGRIATGPIPEIYQASPSLKIKQECSRHLQTTWDSPKRGGKPRPPRNP
jgi:hypothetical protein